jgi:hypothetical protein
MIMAAMATMPERSLYLPGAVESIRPQVDILRVYLNNFDEIPDCLAPEEVVFSQEADGDLGAEGKLYWYGKEEGRGHDHYVSIDDDILYPPDYVERLQEEFEVRAGRAVVGVHGFVFDDPIASYIDSRKAHYGFQQALETARPVHVLGTGTMLLGHSALSLTLEDFPRRNTADLQLAIIAQNRRVPLISIPRPEKWLVSAHSTETDTLSVWWETYKDGGRTKAALARAAVASWQLYPDPLRKVS